MSVPQDNLQNAVHMLIRHQGSSLMHNGSAPMAKDTACAGELHNAAFEARHPAERSVEKR